MYQSGSNQETGTTQGTFNIKYYLDTKGGKWWWRGAGVINWEIGIDIYTLICIKWITNKNVLYKKINTIKFKNSEKIINWWKAVNY